MGSGHSVVYHLSMLNLKESPFEANIVNELDNAIGQHVS